MNMDGLMSPFVNHTSFSSTKLGAPTYIDHSCYRFVSHEDLRPQELSSDERDSFTPPRIPVPYSWYVPFSTSREESSLEPFPNTPSPLTSFSSPSSTPAPSDVTSRDTSPNIKLDPTSPIACDVYTQPFSVESLVGDVIGKKGDPSRPAEVFSSAYIDTEVKRSIACQSLLTSLYSQPGLTSTPRRRRSSDRPLPNNPSPNRPNSPYWCHVCNALCVDREDATRHRYHHVTNSDQCRLRTTLYQDHGCVTTHERLDDDRIQCGLCDKVVSHCFFSKHQRLHEGHFCEECGKEFSTNSRLQDHKNTHTGKTPFTCTVCDRQFAKRSSWTQHQRYHRDHRSFMCQFCKKRFNSKYACAVHERLHTGENPYQCAHPGCDKTYPQKIQLKLHMNSHR